MKILCYVLCVMCYVLCVNKSDIAIITVKKLLIIVDYRCKSEAINL